MNQTIDIKFKKQAHDCYSRRKTLEDGTLVIKWICPICGPYKKLKLFPGGRESKMIPLQRSVIPHSGFSLPPFGTITMPTNFYKEGLDALPKIK